MPLFALQAIEHSLLKLNLRSSCSKMQKTAIGRFLFILNYSKY
ncbi:hypothetical protein PALI_a3371 [Pseudoalteromonas aliena SW19]|uniref:Uncharacterized protein n=1 Tax=Pseudoalteromonas aliena SW19 TaxID=1314866 RepID=A0ABR9DUC5_9GAMM|nr:hypothetical protein [Pseudoalteromonas aliena SW19]